MGEKKLAEAYILGIPFGIFGAHNFYLGRKKFGILYLCTLGLFGLGYLFDLVRMKWLVKHVNRHGTGSDSKMISDCYLIGFLGGIFGAHHFYLGNKKLGLFYLCTLGVLTMGWLVDLIRMKQLVKDSNSKREERSLGTAYILSLPPFGIFGAHHYYLGNVRLGLIYTFTFGIFCLGWIMDLFRMKTLVRKAGQDKNSVGTALIMAMPPFGLFGAHHYYLGNYVLGIVYTFTFGIFTIGWIVDLFRMKDLVKASNDPSSDYGTTKVTAYVLCVSPLGIFGAHHFYLERYFNGGFYVATLGLFGFGWIFDILRLPVLYERYADEDKHKYPDEAYIFWFPFGLFGLHHFYLGNKKWGILYACSFGCLGIGWIIDGIRLPSMIRDFNKYVEDPDMNDFRICRPSCRSCSINRCRRGCNKLFSCPCFTNFSLSSSSSSVKTDENGTTGHQTKPRDDFDVIKEMYPDENHELENQTLTHNNGSEIYTIEQSHNSNTPVYDNGAQPGDPGYDEHEFQEICGISNESQNGNEAENYPDQVTDNNAYHDNYPAENYHHVGSYHDNEYHDENYHQENYTDDSNYDNEQYTSDEIRHHGDVTVTVQDGVDHHADERGHQYNEQHNADDTRHYDGVTDGSVQYEEENRINNSQAYNTNYVNDANSNNVHL